MQPFLLFQSHLPDAHSWTHTTAPDGRPLAFNHRLWLLAAGVSNDLAGQAARELHGLGPFEMANTEDGLVAALKETLSALGVVVLHAQPHMQHVCLRRAAKTLFGAFPWWE